MSVVAEGIQQLRGKLSGEPLQIAEETLEFQMKIFARQLAGEDTSADEAKVLAITAGLKHIARRSLEDALISIATKAVHQLAASTIAK